MRRFELVHEASRAGYVEIDVIPYDSSTHVHPARLIPTIQSTAYLLERVPAVRELCGTLLHLARKPGCDVRACPTSTSQPTSRFGTAPRCHPVPQRGDDRRAARRRLLDAYQDYIHEIIVVDDNSTDETADIVRRLAEANPRVRLLERRRTRRRPCAARRLRAATGRTCCRSTATSC
jgi:hypothetical protein